MKDAFGRSIEYVRLSLTDRCNLRCVYCMPPEGVASLPHDEILRIEEFARLIRIIAPLGVKHIRLTGGEPLVRKGIVDLVKEAKQTPGIESVALTTNALLLPASATTSSERALIASTFRSIRSITMSTGESRDVDALTTRWRESMPR